MQRLCHVISLVFTAARQQANATCIAARLVFTMIQYYGIQETSGKGFGVMGSCDLRFIRAAPVHITQQTGRRLMARDFIKRNWGGGGPLRSS